MDEFTHRVCLTVAANVHTDEAEILWITEYTEEDERLIVSGPFPLENAALARAVAGMMWRIGGAVVGSEQ